MRLPPSLPGLAILLAAVFIAHAAPDQPLAWHGSMEIARGGGERGPWQQNDSRYDFVDDPAVALNERGDTAVAWVDQARKAVMFQLLAADGGSRPAPAVDVSRQPRTFSWLPRVAAGPDSPRQWFVLWQEILFSGGSHGGEMMFARTDDDGETFSKPLNLSNSTGGDGKGRINPQVWHNGSYDLVAGPGGRVYAAWTEYDGPLWFSRSLDGGKSFSSPMRLAGGGKTPPARAPSIARAADGTLYLAWTVGDDAAADIHLAKSGDDGRTFSRPRPVGSSKAYSDAPRLAVDPGGVLHLVYAESSAGPFASYQIRHARSADGGRTFQDNQEISTPMPEPFTGAAFPAVGLDKAGRLYVTWELYQDARRQPRGLGLAVSRDGGRRFTSPVVIPQSIDPAGGFNGSSQGLLMQKLAVNGAGQVAVANSALKQGSHSRVWLMRGAMPR